MHIEIKPADNIDEAKALLKLDKKIFPAGDCFNDPDYWADYECFWILADGQVVGSTALGLDMEFDDVARGERPSVGCIHIGTTGILPEFQRQGIGDIVKKWQIDYARTNGFKRMSTNCRKSNLGSLRLNQKYGFEVTEEIPNHYWRPREAGVVMRLVL